MVSSGQVLLPDENATADMEEAGQRLLHQLGYERYEISNYAKPGFRCRHNLGYWQDAWYLGLGVAAHSMLPGEAGRSFRVRRANPESVEKYIAARGNLAQYRTEEAINAEEAMFETIMLSLRMVDGLNHAHFGKLYGITLRERYGHVLDSLIREGLAENDGEAFRLTRRGLSLQNRVLMRFMD